MSTWVKQQYEILTDRKEVEHIQIKTIFPYRKLLHMMQQLTISCFELHKMDWGGG